MERVEEIVGARPVVIFSKSSCCMSHAILILIRSFGANPAVYELDRLPNGEGVAMEKALSRIMGRNPTLPAVFVGKDFLGGSDEIISLNIKGKLKPLLLKANAIWM